MTDSDPAPSRSEDTHRPWDPGIVLFMLALGPNMGTSAVVIVRFATSGGAKEA